MYYGNFGSTIIIAVLRMLYIEILPNVKALYTLGTCGELL